MKPVKPPPQEASPLKVADGATSGSQAKKPLMTQMMEPWVYVSWLIATRRVDAIVFLSLTYGKDNSHIV
jgi:hypothetical protein